VVIQQCRTMGFQYPSRWGGFVYLGNCYVSLQESCDGLVYGTGIGWCHIPSFETVLFEKCICWILLFFFKFW
jgi:hypothetical protein